ncbi:MAG: sulfite exporter TauE/SafE family protein [Burkholderiales bacterium]|nr:sulfite exporter TauE/SafE family protein [Burkholderiales bacterium]
MDLALLASALLLGLASVPHCTAMCAAPCAAVTGGPAQGRATRWIAFHAMRVLAYSIAGAVAASSVGVLGTLADWTPMLQPLWTLVHAAAFALGLWLLWCGRQPAWLEAIGRGSFRAAAPAARWQRVRAPLRAGLAGGMWVAWPCGLLHSALLVAAMASSTAAGAIVMGGFAAVTAAGLALGPALWAWVGGGAVAARAAGWGVRLAGLALAGASGFALGHGLWMRIAPYC